MTVRLALALVTLACVVPAAASGSSPDPQKMVAQLSDLPSGFARAGGHYASNAYAQAHDATHEDYSKFGRLTGYSAGYSKHGAVGLLQIESETNLYRSGQGAHSAFVFGVNRVATQTAVHFKRLIVGSSSLGQESRLYRVRETSGGLTADVYIVVWRSGRVISTVTGAAVAATADPKAVVAIAEKQQRRVASATG